MAAGIAGLLSPRPEGRPNQLHCRQPAVPTTSVDTIIKTISLFIIVVSYQEMIGLTCIQINKTTLHHILFQASDRRSIMSHTKKTCPTTDCLGCDGHRCWPLGWQPSCGPALPVTSATGPESFAGCKEAWPRAKRADKAEDLSQAFRTAAKRVLPAVVVIKTSSRAAADRWKQWR